MKIDVDGIAITCFSLQDLQVQIKDKLAAIERRLKNIRDEEKKLRREQRKLKSALEGEPSRKPPAHAASALVRPGVSS